MLLRTIAPGFCLGAPLAARPPKRASRDDETEAGRTPDGSGVAPRYFLLAGAFFFAAGFLAAFFAGAFLAGFFAALANVVLLLMPSRESAHGHILVQLMR